MGMLDKVKRLGGIGDDNDLYKSIVIVVIVARQYAPQHINFSELGAQI
jgi:hypothetical protein